MMLTIALVILKNTFEAGYINIWVFLILSLLVGAAVGFFTVYEKSYQNLPINKDYLDIEKMKQRIQVLQNCKH